MNAHYTVTLTQKSRKEAYSRPSTSFSFNELSADLPVIYQHFSFLSYLSPSCGVTIRDRYQLGNKPEITVDQFFIRRKEEIKEKAGREQRKKMDRMSENKEQIDNGENREKLYLFQISKDKYSKKVLSQGVLKIIYCIGTEPSSIPNSNCIEITFTTEIDNQQDNKYIHIKVNDHDNWLQRTFKDAPTIGRMSQMRKTKDCEEGHIDEVKGRIYRELEYFYQEPLLIRNREIKGRHLSLALQGGGVKGLAYIGAYEGIKKSKQKEQKVRSLIGSSAGGILGLAICCQMQNNEIEDLIKRDLASITKNDKKFRQEDPNFVRDQMQILENFLRNYGIVDDVILDVIVQSLSDENMHACFKDLLEKFNPSIMQLFTVGNEKFSVRGLLNATLMTGDVIKGIAKTCLKSLAKRKNIRVQTDLDVWAEYFTMKEFYKQTGIEFTCTSTDIDSQILRFFNHKTTPDLPVCRAVQMTGSFPVAFEAQKWREEWGKYYIHYERIRREIDLTGHQFTDGGMLANFPIKYLDNENMRPMYFSHPKISSVENQTIMYGFGLNALPEESSTDYSEIFARMKDIVMDKVKSRRFVWNFVKSLFNQINFCCGTPNPVNKAINTTQNPISDLTKIPLIDFGSRLIKTFISTKDNLTEECFAHSSYETELSTLRNLSIKKSRRTQRQQLEAFISKFKQLKGNELNQPDSDKDIHEKYIQNFGYLCKQITESPYTEFRLLELMTVVNITLSKYIFIRQGLKQYEVPQGVRDIMNNLLKLDQMNQSQILSLCNIKEDMEDLLAIVKQAQKWFKDVYEGRHGNEAAALRESLSIIRAEERKKIKGFEALLKEYLNEIDKPDYGCGYLPMKQTDLIEIMKLGRTSITTDLSKTYDLAKQMRKCGIDQFQIFFEAFQNRSTIECYVKQQLKQGEKQGAKDIHIVLESVPLSEMYFHEYMTYIQDAIQTHRMGNKELKISSMTASNFHSVVMFLYASDYSPERIHREVWNIRHLMRMNPRMEDEFNSFSWANNNIIKMKELQQEVWKNRKEIFTLANKEIAQALRKVEGDPNETLDQFLKTMHERNSECLDSCDHLNEALLVSIDYVVDAVKDVDPSDKQSLRQLEQISKKLAYNLDMDQRAFQNAYTQEGLNTKSLINFLSNKYLDLIKYLVYASPFVTEEIAINLSEEDRKNVWKGLIICEAMNVFKLKAYICESLIELGLKAHTTLQEYYKMSGKKITLNFTAIDSATNSIIIINHHTRPNMPVWAAIVATTSMPEFFRPLPDMKEWAERPVDSFRERETKEYFRKKTEKRSVLRSADILTKLPLDLISNHKIKQKIKSPQKEIFLIFNFTNYKLPEFQHVENIESKPLTALQLWCKKNLLGNIGNIKDLPMVQERLNRIKTYIQSHDNLITGFYKDELAQLPIRVQTLDFSKMVTDGELSAQSKDAIMQSEYVAREKILNNKGREERFMFFMVASRRLDKDKDDNFIYDEDLVIRQLAKLNPTNSFMERYKVFYTLEGDVQSKESYKQVKTEFISIKFPQGNNGTVCLSITYPKDSGNKGLKRQSICHRLDLFQLKKLGRQVKYGNVYQLKFNEYVEAWVELAADNDKKNPHCGLKVRYKSFVGPEMKHQYRSFCNKPGCNGNKLKLINEEVSAGDKSAGSCFNRDCKSEKSSVRYRLVYECENCSSKYCPSCKFQPYLEGQNIVCPLGHPIGRRPERKIGDDKNLTVWMCQICLNTTIYQPLYDKECNVEICETCRYQFLKKG